MELSCSSAQMRWGCQLLQENCCRPTAKGFATCFDSRLCRGGRILCLSFQLSALDCLRPNCRQPQVNSVARCFVRHPRTPCRKSRRCLLGKLLLIQLVLWSPCQPQLHRRPCRPFLLNLLLRLLQQPQQCRMPRLPRLRQLQLVQRGPCHPQLYPRPLRLLRKLFVLQLPQLSPCHPQLHPAPLRLLRMLFGLQLPQLSPCQLLLWPLPPRRQQSHLRCFYPLFLPLAPALQQLPAQLALSRNVFSPLRLLCPVRPRCCKR
jgi:hypothetical protein